MSLRLGGPIPVEERTDHEVKFFEDLQEYANYQQALSEKLDSDISRGDISGESSSHNLVSTERGRSKNPLGALPSPIFIPQHELGGVGCGWTRAYTPSLQRCGIDQRRFQNFLDILSQHSMSVPYLDAINIGALSAHSPTELIDAAVNLSKATSSATHTFLSRANTEFLGPRNLHSTIVVFKPDTSSQIIRVDAMQPVPQSPHHFGDPLIDLIRPAPLALLGSDDPLVPVTQAWVPQSNTGMESAWEIDEASAGGMYQPMAMSHQAGTMDFGAGISGGAPESPVSGEMKIRPGILYLMIANDTTRQEYSHDGAQGQQGFRGPVLFI